MIRSFFRNASWVLGSNLVNKLLSFFTLGILSRLLAGNSFGLYSAFVSANESINQLTEGGVNIVLQKSLGSQNEINKKDIEEKIGAVIIMIVGVLVLLLLTFLLFKTWIVQNVFSFSLESAIAGWIAYMPFMIALLKITQLGNTVIIGFANFKQFAIRVTVGNLIATSLIPILGYLYGLAGALTGISITYIFNTAYVVHISKSLLKLHGIKPSFSNFQYQTRSIFDQGFVYFIGNTLGGSLVSLLTIGLFAKFIGIEQYGYIRIAAAIVSVIGIVPAAIQPVMITFLVRFSKGQAILKSLQIRLVLSIIIMCSFGLILFIEPIIQVLFGSSYQGGKQFISCIIFINIFIVAGQFFSNFLVASGRANLVGFLGIVGSAITLTFSYLLIPNLGITGYLISYASGYLIGFFTTGYQDLKSTGYEDVRQMVFVPVLFLAGIIAVVTSLYFNNILTIIISFICFLFFSLSILWQKVLLAHEKAILLSITIKKNL